MWARSFIFGTKAKPSFDIVLAIHLSFKLETPPQGKANTQALWRYQLLSSHCYHSDFLSCFTNKFTTASTWHNGVRCKELWGRDSPLAPASLLCTQSRTGSKSHTALVHSAHWSELHLLSKLSFGMNLARAAFQSAPLWMEQRVRSCLNIAHVAKRAEAGRQN